MPITKTVLAAATFAFATPTALAGTMCDFYADTKFEGGRFTLYDGHALIAASGVSLGDWLSGRSADRTFQDVRWAGGVASVRVQSGCTGHLWDGANDARVHADAADVRRAGANAIAYACTCG